MFDKRKKQINIETVVVSVDDFHMEQCDKVAKRLKIVERSMAVLLEELNKVTITLTNGV